MMIGADVPVDVFFQLVAVATSACVQMQHAYATALHNNHSRKKINTSFCNFDLNIALAFCNHKTVKHDMIICGPIRDYHEATQ